MSKGHPLSTLGRIAKPDLRQVIVYLAAVSLGLLMALIPTSKAGAVAQYGTAGRMLSGTFYGVRARNTVTNATVVSNYQWVDSSYVRSADGFNGVEVGWIEKPDNVRNAFAVVVYNGSLSYHNLGPAMNVGSNHIFAVQSQSIPGEFQWNYYVDSTYYWAYTHYAGSFSQVWSAQERVDPTTGTTSHFWSLQYGTSGGTWASWYTLDTSYDTDPSFSLCVVTTTEFWVKPSCP